MLALDVGCWMLDRAVNGYSYPTLNNGQWTMENGESPQCQAYPDPDPGTSLVRLSFFHCEKSNVQCPTKTNSKPKHLLTLYMVRGINGNRQTGNGESEKIGDSWRKDG